MQITSPVSLTRTFELSVQLMAPLHDIVARVVKTIIALPSLGQLLRLSGRSMQRVALLISNLPRNTTSARRRLVESFVGGLGSTSPSYTVVNGLAREGEHRGGWARCPVSSFCCTR